MMTTGASNGGEFALDHVDVDTHVSRIETTAVAVLNRSEIETQVDCAHKYPRSVKKFLQNAMTLATISRDVAESCIYALPRGGKSISGPSVRLAEIVASAYGNLHVASRVLDAEDREIVAQGVAWDLEQNLRVTIEARRRITKANGKRYDDDMIVVTGAAAGSIALRNAIFRVVPRAYIDIIYAKVREVAVGNAKTLADRRAEVIAKLQKMGVPIERIFARVDKAAIEDVGLEELEILIGLGTAIKNGDRRIDDAFPSTDKSTPETKALEDELRGDEKPAEKPKAKREPKKPESEAAATLPITPPKPREPTLEEELASQGEPAKPMREPGED